MEEYRYYVIHKKEKHYFPFNLQGFKEAQAFIENCGYKKRTIHVERQVKSNGKQLAGII